MERGRSGRLCKGWEEIEAFGFLTTDSAEPVILTQPEECDLWLSGADWEAVKPLQRPLPDGLLKIFAPPAPPGLAAAS